MEYIHTWSAWASLEVQMVKNLPAMQETWVQSLGQEEPLEKGMATHSSILAWKIPWMEEPGRLQSMGLQRVGHDWTTSLSTSWNSPSTSSSNWNLVISWEQSIPGRLSYTSYSCIQSHVAVGGSSSLFLTGMPIPLDPHSLTNPPIVRLAFWLYHRAPGL